MKKTIECEKDPRCVQLDQLWTNLNGTKASVSEFRSIIRFIFIYLMPPEEIADAMFIAHERVPHETRENIFRYFCGVCHGKIRGSWL